MVSVQTPPGHRELPYARVLLLPAILMAAVTGGAVAAVTEPARAAVGWCGAVATLLVTATVAEAARRGRAQRARRAESDRHTALLEQRIASHEHEMLRFAHEITPAALDRLHSGESPGEVIRRIGETDPSYRDLPAAQVRLLKTVLGTIDKEEALRDSSQRSFVDIARRVQAIVHQQAKELREMEEDHGRNPEVFDDLLRLDHGTALIGRLADSISVLGGGRPGRQWPQPVPLYSVLRGAMSRILEYRRISLDVIAKVNINGVSVEPVIHACAELLDNATRYSPPQTKVHVTATEVQTGVAIEIEDAGVSLSDEARARAEGMLERAMTGGDLQDLGESPRLGLAVVGRLCKTYDMQISLRTSAYGGVRAVLIVPRAMMTDGPAPGVAHGVGATALPKAELGALEGPKRPPKKRRPTSPRIPAGVSMVDEVPEVTEWTAGGLPQRRSRMKTPLSRRLAEQAAMDHAEREVLEAHSRSAWGAPPPAAPDPAEPEPGLWVEAFMNGLKDDPDPTVTSQPKTEQARAEADDERDLK
ncbi:ATP-binding protein [Streptomyces sp. NPDC005840]|uniref:histidine kinase n=1 Tax=Streptomyces doudnae TaxID=3075536 RepID=A0ABD5EVP8_9ACTN|nr:MULTISPECIES: ATP-binding protein [unclassified Streptomyces]MDT0437467.1 ATP-binding protein [Streptomyces sp. DSM 41981]MYQ66436.1 sensor histidine kinase [Streptomyces sp. SID4950]SCE20340.1 Signal transduction histidine kinase [Streptomyces sp. SolWspMP-5a-2]